MSKNKGDLYTYIQARFQICRVCQLIDGDEERKFGDVCPTCDVFICEKCQPNLIRRGMAMLKDRL